MNNSIEYVAPPVIGFPDSCGGRADTTFAYLEDLELAERFGPPAVREMAGLIRGEIDALSIMGPYCLLIDELEDAVYRATGVSQ